MKNLELLKKLTFVADRLQIFSNLDFKNIKIRINTLLDDSDLLIYAFKVLEIPFETYTPDHENFTSPEEINLSIGYKVDLKIIFYITYISKEIFDNKINIYICYATSPEGRESSAIFGTYITTCKNFTNISRPITPREITVLDIDNSTWESFSNLFPNNNYASDGKCTFTREFHSNYHSDNNDDYDDYHERESYSQYEGSYAQEVEGLSDDFINDVLDGNPDAYWNID